MQAFRTLDLPCPWVPLQSMTAAASRRFPDRKELTVYLRGKATDRLESLCCASGFGTHARRRALRAFVDERGKPQTTAKPDARGGDASGVSDVGRSRGSTRCADAGDVELCRTLAEAAVQPSTRSRVTARASIVATSFARTRAEARERALPRRLEIGRSLNRSDEATLLDAHGRSRERPRGLLRDSGLHVSPPKRVNERTVLPRDASHL
jgi:hypothetical protein